MTKPEFYTLAELSAKHGIKKPTLVERVKRRNIPHRKIGNTITIRPEHVEKLLKSGLRAVPLRNEALYRKWGRLKRSPLGMATKWEKSFDAFNDAMYALPNAGEGRLQRIDPTKGCFVDNMRWA